MLPVIHSLGLSGSLLQKSTYQVSKSVVYFGPSPFKALKVISKILQILGESTGMMGSYLFDWVMSVAGAF